MVYHGALSLALSSDQLLVCSITTSSLHQCVVPLYVVCSACGTEFSITRIFLWMPQLALPMLTLLLSCHLLEPAACSYPRAKCLSPFLKAP